MDATNRQDATGPDEKESDYYDVLIAEYHRQIKEFVDWFVVKYDRLIEKRCRIAAMRCGCLDIWEDLKLESLSQAYLIANRFSPEKGDLLTFLISSLWMFPFRNDVVNKYLPNYSIDTANDFENPFNNMSAANIPCHRANVVGDPVYSFDEITEASDDQDKMLLTLSYSLNMPNTKIAALVGLSESAIRSRLHTAITKLKIKWKNSEDKFYPN